MVAETQENHVIGMGHCLVTGDPNALLITYALGSCIAVLIHDPVAHVGGLLHFMLPDTHCSPGRGKDQPCMFAGSGLSLLFASALDLGAKKNRLRVYAAGGANVVDDGHYFNVGRKNEASLREILAKEGIAMAGEALGGKVSRMVKLDNRTGEAWVREGVKAFRRFAPQPNGKPA